MRRRVKGAAAALLTLLLAFGLLVGCDQGPDQKQDSYLKQITGIVDDPIAGYTMEPYWKDAGLELLDLVEEEAGYTLLAQDSGKTYQIKLDRQFQEQSRTETALPDTSRTLATKKGAFAYAKNEAGLFDLYKDGEPYLAVGGEAGGDCQLLFSGGRLYAYADGRVFCDKQEVSLDAIRSNSIFLGSTSISPIGIMEWDGQVFAVVRTKWKEPPDADIYCPVSHKTGELQLEGSFSAIDSGIWFCSNDSRLYFADGSGLIYVVQEVNEGPVEFGERTYLDMTEESLPWNNLRQMAVLSDRRIILLFSDRLVQVTPVFNPNDPGET